MGVKKLGLKRSSTGLIKHRSKKIGIRSIYNARFPQNKSINIRTKKYSS